MKKILVGITGSVLGCGALYVFGHKPDVVKHPCKRSTFRKDGKPKVAFDTAYRANLQTIIQLLFYGELCNSYQVGGKYYTGHSSRRKI